MPNNFLLDNQILNIITEMVVVIDKDENCVFVNNAFKRFFKRKDNVLEGKKFSQLIDNEDYESVVQPALQQCKNGQTVSIPGKVKMHLKNHLSDFNIKLIPYKSENNIFEALVAIICKHNSLENKQIDQNKIVNITDDLLLVINKNFEIEKINKSALKFLNEDENEIIGRKCHKLIFDNDKVCNFCPRINKIIRTDKDFFEVYSTKYKKWIKYRLSIEEDNEGEIFRSVNLLKDISEQKDSSLHSNPALNTYINSTESSSEPINELKKQVELFAILLNNLRQGVFMVEVPSGKPILANDAALEILGRGILPDASKSNLANVYKAYRINTDEPYPTDEMPIILGMSGVSSYIDDMVVERPDGERRNVEIYGSPVINDKGEIWASLVSFSDITVRKNLEADLVENYTELIASEEELRAVNEELVATTDALSESNAELQFEKDKAQENELKYRLLFENAPLGIIHYNTQAVIISCNTKFAEIIGSPRSILEGLDMFKLPDKKLTESIRLSLDGVSGYYNDTYHSVTSGKETPVQIVFAPIVSDDNKIIGEIGIIEDITERKAYEIELKNKNDEYLALNEELRLINEDLIETKEKAEESDRLKTEFINNMSHEIRTPMNGILGFAKLLEKDDLSKEKKTNFINIIQSSGSQLLRVIDDILEISRLGTKQVKVLEEETSVNDILVEMFSVFDVRAKENKIPLYINKQLSDQKSTIYTDESKIKKIVSNLLENAFKFTSKGFIELGCKICENKENEKFIEIYVKDTGIGIKPEHQKIIFNRFAQADKKLRSNIGGLGLGLAIAKENAELLGGNISLVSETGKGSVFSVKIPYKPVHETQTAAYENSLGNNDKLNGNFYKILIAEDEEINYFFLETLINDVIELKCDIFHAKNGKEAVDMCKKIEKLDLVLMDIKMPVMNGIDAVKIIRKFNSDIPIVAQTAYSTVDDRENAMSVGFNDFISKPINEDLLKLVIDKFLIVKA